MADWNGDGAKNKSRRKKSSSSSSSSSPQVNVEIESTDAGKDCRHGLLGACATTKSGRGGGGGENLIYVSPSRVRFQHSRIRPQFSGCGRSVTETLEQIRLGQLEPGDLPPIQVIIGTINNTQGGGGGEEEREPWYFSLNNRRLWVLKQCHREGLLDNERYNNKIGVRARVARSQAETLRYTVDNCALEAKFMREESGKSGSRQTKKGTGKKKTEEENNDIDGSKTKVQNDDRFDKIKKCGTCVNNDYDYGESDDDDDDDFVSRSNPFSALS